MSKGEWLERPDGLIVPCADQGVPQAAWEQDNSVTYKLTQVGEIAAYIAERTADPSQQFYDPYRSNFAAYTAEALETTESLPEALNLLLEAKPYMSAVDVFNSLEKSMQHYVMHKHPEFPVGFDNREAWQEAYKEVAVGQGYGQFIVDLFSNIRSNLGKRGLPSKIISVIEGKGVAADWLEVGTSQMHILKMMALLGSSLDGDKKLQYGQTYVNDRVSGTTETVNNASLTSAFQILARDRNFSLGTGIGVDLLDFERDKLVAERAKSDSFRPRELLNPVNTMLYNYLDRTKVSNVMLVSGNFAFIDRYVDTLLQPREQFDVVTMPTVLYQLPPEQTQLMIKNALDRLKPDGILIIQDFVDIDNAGNLNFHEKWLDYTYSTWVYHKAEPERGWEKYFSIEDGRVKNIVIEGVARKAMQHYFEQYARKELRYLAQTFAD